MKRNPARRAALLAAALVLSSSAVPSLGARPAAASGAPGRLAGVVRDETGAPLAGVEVRLTTPGGPVAAEGRADEGGRYSISTAAGLYDMTVVAADDAGPWTAHVKNMPVWSDTPLDFAVVRPAPPAGGGDTAGGRAEAPEAGPADEIPPAGETSAEETPGASGVTWAGLIIGPGGGPVEPGGLAFEPAPGAPAGSLDVGSDGSFAFTGPAGPYSLVLATGLYPWDGGSWDGGPWDGGSWDGGSWDGSVGSGPDDGLVLTAAVELTTDRSDDLRLPAGGPADVVVAAIDGRKRSDLLTFTAERSQPVELAPGVAATATVHDTIGAEEAHYGPLLFGPSTATFAVPDAGEGTTRPVIAPLSPGDRLAIAIGDRTTAPAAPRDVTVTAGDGRIKATWKPPAGDGGSPITGYVITASAGGSNSRATYPETATSGAVRNLINGTAYTVTVTARNAKGGTASAPVTVTPDGSSGGGGDNDDNDDPPGEDALGGAGSGGTGPGSTTDGDPRSGYWLLGADGAVYAFGDAALYGDASAALAAASAPATGGPPIRAVDLEPTASGGGYWVLDTRGRVHPFGDAGHFGDAGGPDGPARLAAGEAAASLSGTPTGAGYWVFTNRGRAIAFGDAAHLGDMTGTVLTGPVLDSVVTPSGRGYYMVASDGGIFAFGDARFAGSMGGRPLDAPVRSVVPDGDGGGYWLVASDGGVFAFGAGFRGSMGGRPLDKPVRGMVRYGDGYVMVAEDGGVFNFSDRPFSGSLVGRPPASPVVSVGALG